MARPSKRTPERELAILNSLRIGCTRSDACQAGEISHETFRRWLRYEGFRAEVEHAEAEAGQRFVGNVARAASNSWQAAAWWLERRRPEFRKREGVELTGKDGGPVEVKAHPLTEALTRGELAEKFRGIVAELDPALTPAELAERHGLGE
jgi:hypothetical protein